MSLPVVNAFSAPFDASGAMSGVGGIWTALPLAYPGPLWFEPYALLFQRLPLMAQYGFAALLGLIIGSFLTVVVHRVPIMLEAAWSREVRGMANAQGADPPLPDEHQPATPTYNLWLPPSACSHCGHRLRPWENLPLIGYLLLRGRCSACGASIGWHYVALEIATAALAMVSLATFGASWVALAAFGLAAALLALAAIDAASGLLPDIITLPLLWAGLIVNLEPTFVSLHEAVLGAIAGYLCLWAIYWAFRLLRGIEGMGYGDFKLLAAIGAWLGWTVLPQVVLIASLMGAFAGLVWYWRGRLLLSQPLPFGPFLALGAWLPLFCGTPLYRLFGA